MIFDWDNLLAQLAQEREGSWKQFLVPIIIFTVYAVVSLFKGKPKPPPTKTGAPGAQPAPRRSAPLPPYARNRQQPTQSTTGAQQQSTRPAPARRPAPRPIPTAGDPQPAPRPARPSTQAGQPRPARKKSQTRTAPAMPPAKARILSEAMHHAQTARTKKSAAGQRQTAHGRRSGHQHLEPAAPAQLVEHPLEPLQASLHRRSNLARAILYAEILGKPLGLRPGGAHQYGE